MKCYGPIEVRLVGARKAWRCTQCAWTELSGLPWLEVGATLSRREHEQIPAQDISLIRQRLREIIERHQSEEGNKPALCGLCTDDGVNNQSWPCDAYAAAHIGLGALDG